MWSRKNASMIAEGDALPGRTDQVMAVPDAHHVTGVALVGPWPQGYQSIVVGMGCFWGAERMFWTTPGVYSTFVGYAGGYTPNPTYEEVCSGRTGHTEVVGVVYDPSVITLEGVLRVFWEGHDPTQGMRQGNDIGTQYRSAVYVADESLLPVVEATREVFQRQLTAAGYGPITTEIAVLTDFYYAEPYHQQYLSKNPNGYCGIGGTGVSCPIGVLG